MQIREILANYPDDALDQLAADKLDEVTGIRLPREVLIQEITSALGSHSYVAEQMAPLRPPSYAILKLLLHASSHRLPAEHFRTRVIELTHEFTRRAEDGQGMSSSKNYDLYLRILRRAWQDRHIDRSEAELLAALRHELGIWMREHLLLEHHPSVREHWDDRSAFTEARRILLRKGLVLQFEDDLVIADEVCHQIRNVWEIELEDPAYRRMLQHLNVQQLRHALEAMDLPLSGSKEERIERLVKALVPPKELLDTLHIFDVKEFCRRLGLAVTGSKAELIASIIDHFDAGRDLMCAVPNDEAVARAIVPEPEARELTEEQFAHLLERLTQDHLYDILERRSLRRSGSKQERIQRLVGCPWSERTLLHELRGSALAELCRNLDVPVSGIKDERVDRLLAWAADPRRSRDLEIEEQQPEVASQIDGECARLGALASQAVQSTSPRPEVPELSKIQARYPDLEQDEAIVLAILQQARSLNEEELMRAVRQQGSEWSLVKAHMADLLARLRHAGNCPIRLRSTGPANIYEWVGGGETDGPELNRSAAREVIDALRHGVVPSRHLQLLAVGQERSREHLSGLLDHISERASEFRFLRGSYGSGKTFLCSWLRDQALERGYAVSSIRVRTDQPLSDLPLFFSMIVDGLHVPEKRDACASADVLEAWLLQVERRTERLQGNLEHNPFPSDELEEAVVERIQMELASFVGSDPALAHGISAFYKAKLRHDYETTAKVLAWLRGGQVFPLQARRTLGLDGPLDPSAVFPRLRALLEMILGSHLKGLVVFVDELELVQRLPHARQREQTYETLRLIIDECGENHLPGCLLLFTGTDQLFEDARYGIQSYRALWNRIQWPPLTSGPTSVRQPIIELEPLDERRLVDLARRVRDLHSTAYGWPAEERITEEFLEQMADDFARFGDGKVGRLPRAFLRRVVYILDICEEQPDVAPGAFLQTPVSEREVALSILSEHGAMENEGF